MVPGRASSVGRGCLECGKIGEGSWMIWSVTNVSRLSWDREKDEAGDVLTVE